MNNQKPDINYNQEAYIDFEERNGVRCSFNVLPINLKQQQNCVMPVGFLYTPYKEIDELFKANYPAIKCGNQNNCEAILNPHCLFDWRNFKWQCNICRNFNPFPQFYRENMSADRMAPEMYEKNSTIEYVFANNKAKYPPPCFIFVLDIVNSSKKEELLCARDAMQQALGYLPQNCKVAFISFGKNVYLHQLCNNEIQTITVVRGTREYTQKEIEAVMRITDKNGIKTNFINKYVSNFDDCQVQLSTILDNLEHDDWSQDPTHRPEICSGVAVQCATTLATHLLGTVGCGRILFLTSGVCTVGSGKIVDIPYDIKLRMYNDIYNKDTAMTKYVEPAKKFYDEQVKALNCANFAFDIICSSVDQMGLYEMKYLAEKTGGTLVFNDTYMSDVFKKSLIKIFTKNKSLDEDEEEEEGYEEDEEDLTPSLENCAYNCQVKVLLSPNLRLCGCIGHCFGFKENANKNYISEIKIGECGTNVYRMGQCDRTQTYAYYLETKNDGTMNVPPAFVQLQFLYYNAETQEKRMRVTTIKKIFSSHENALTDIKDGFDQDAAFVLFARISIRKIDSEPSVQDVVRWLDKQLIKFCHKMGKYINDVPNSFKLPEKLDLFPVYIYYFRRSTLLRIFNMSPDEAEMYRIYFFRENVNNSLSLVQCSLISFEKDYSWNIVDLDVKSMRSDCVLVMDSFKEIVVWKGEAVYKLEVNQEVTENVEWMIGEAVKYARDQANSRFPYPRIIVCHAGSGPERFIKNKVNPSTSSFKDPNNEDGGNFFTDEFGLNTFMSTLKKYAVTE